MYSFENKIQNGIKNCVSVGTTNIIELNFSDWNDFTAKHEDSNFPKKSEC